MMKINVCPCTLAEGFETYSPAARKMLFDGKAVSHLFHGTDPASDSAESQEAFKAVISNIATPVTKSVRK